MPVHGRYGPSGFAGLSLNDRVQELLMKLLGDIKRGRAVAQERGVYSMRLSFIELSLLENVFGATLRDISQGKWEHYKDADPFEPGNQHTNFEDGAFYDYNFKDAKNEWNDGQKREKREYNAEKDRYEPPKGSKEEPPSMNETMRRRREQAEAQRKEENAKWRANHKGSFDEQWKAYEDVFRQAGYGAEFNDFAQGFDHYSRQQQKKEQPKDESKAKTPPKGRSKLPWWEVLGIARDSNRAQIKRAYRLLASRHHPDRGGDKDMMQDINRAKAEAFEAVGA